MERRDVPEGGRLELRRGAPHEEPVDLDSLLRRQGLRVPSVFIHLHSEDAGETAATQGSAPGPRVGLRPGRPSPHRSHRSQRAPGRPRAPPPDRWLRAVAAQGDAGTEPGALISPGASCPCGGQVVHLGREPSGRSGKNQADEPAGALGLSVGSPASGGPAP